MNIQFANIRVTAVRSALGLLSALALVTLAQLSAPRPAQAAACQAPSPSYGSATANFSVPSGGNYRVWSRVMPSNNTNNSYLLEVDGSQCFRVGNNGSMAAGQWSWVDYKDANTGSKININLNAGNHTIKMLGSEPDVKLDKVLFVAGGCIPEGLGQNCEVASDTAAPVVELTAPEDGANVSGQVELTAQAEDDEGGSGMNKVEFYVNNELKGSDANAPYTASWDAREAEDGDYTISVKAYDKAGNTSRDSVEVKLQNGTIDDQAPNTPANVSAEAEDYDRVRVAWEASTDNVGVAGYRVYRNNSQIANITASNGAAGPATVYTDNDVEAGTRYVYTVAAYDQIGNVSQASNPVAVTTPTPPAEDTTPPSAPANLRAEAAGRAQINLAWNASTDNVGVAGYDIYRSTGSSGASKVGSTGQTSFGDTNLNPGTEYAYYVVAKDAAGNQSGQSAAVSATTASPLDPGPEPGNGGGGDRPFFCSFVWINFLCGDRGATNQTGAIVGNVDGIKDVKVRIFINGKQKIYRTDSQGNYRITGLSAGKYPVIFTHPGYFLNAEWVRVREGQTTTQDMRMFSRDIRSLINSFWSR